VTRLISVIAGGVTVAVVGTREVCTTVVPFFSIVSVAVAKLVMVTADCVTVTVAG